MANVKRVSRDNDTPQEFYDELFGSDESDNEGEDLGDGEVMYEDGHEDEGEPDEEDDQSDEDDTTSPPAYSPLASPKPLPHRSRSPLGRRGLESDAAEAPAPDANAADGIVIGIFDEDGVEVQRMDVDSLEFFDPDAHALFIPAQPGRGASVRQARARGRGSGRPGPGRGRGRGARTAGRTRWENGMPLEEIFLTDADVPPELVTLARQVVRGRAAARERVREHPADSGSDEEQHFNADGEAAEEEPFEWLPMDSFTGTQEPFLQEHTGSVKTHSTAYGAFRTYWSDDFLQEIVDQTNQYAARISSASFQAEWFPTNVHEILCLFAFWMMLGIIRMPTIKSCFVENGILKTGVFKMLFGPRRYINLTRALHFADERDEGVKNDRLGLIRPIVTRLNASFKAEYDLSQKIALDESLCLWKGRLNIKQYLPLKAAKFGIKTFEICESTTGYLWSFIVYTGKQRSLDVLDSSCVLKSTAIVKTLIRPLLNKGYQLFMDSWYNCPSLARWLKRHHTDCVGTLRPSCSHVSKLVQIAPLKRGQLIARHSGDVCVLAWQDKKRVNMISTCHGSATAMSTVTSNPNPKWPILHKPQMVLDYNKYMGGVDLKDQMLEPYLIERKRCAKWYMKLFKRLLNVSILNSRILLESCLTHRQDHLAFRLSLVNSIIDNHLFLCPVTRPPPQPPALCPVTNKHWLITMPSTDALRARNRQARKRCLHCYRQSRPTTTPYICEECNVPLCVMCMKAYHTQ